MVGQTANSKLLLFLSKPSGHIYFTGDHSINKFH
ncbi:hypothetical protein Xsto_03522 [Xenorhabdus stockiae]|uniref:Uncharacterized protein n=1 Tax=Xenorhabdus stockiae TaxID=351614 RepID=A0A2D0KKG5_9GAMM|nr:hypothetical protein Xsto_03522 [Xenorhabdus stockiae]